MFIKNCLKLSKFLTEIKNIENSRRLMEFKFLNQNHQILILTIIFMISWTCFEFKTIKIMVSQAM